MSSPTAASLRYKCILCTFVGKDGEQLGNHLEKEHSRNNLFWCRLCGKASSYADELIDHLDKNACNGTFNHPCGFEGCDFTDLQPARFAAHLKSAHKGQTLFPCMYCKRLFTMAPCLIAHIQVQCCNKPETTHLPATLPDENNEKTAYSVRVDPPSVPARPAKRPSNDQKSAMKTDNASNGVPSVKKNKPGPKAKPGPKTKPGPKVKKTKKVSVQPIPQLPDHSDSDVDDPTWNPLESSKICPITSDLTRKRSIVSKPATSSDTSKRKRKVLQVRKMTSNESDSKDVECNTWDGWFEIIKIHKSPEALEEVLKPENVTNFFKCMQKTCTFSSQDKMDFALHVLNSNHTKELNKCSYCFSTFAFIEKFLSHLMSEHGERRWQCSACFYRSCNKASVKFHIHKAHASDAEAEVLKCKQIDLKGVKKSNDGENEEERDAYYCCVSECNFNTLITDQFRDHFAEVHPKLKVYSCCYCEYDDKKLDNLLNHFHCHGINNFECYYCWFGADSSDEVLIHMGINHADLKSQVLSRSSNQKAASEVPSSSKKQNKNLSKSGKRSKSNSGRPPSPDPETNSKSSLDTQEESEAPSANVKKNDQNNNAQQYPASLDNAVSTPQSTCTSSSKKQNKNLGKSGKKSKTKSRFSALDPETDSKSSLDTQEETEVPIANLIINESKNSNHNDKVQQYSASLDDGVSTSDSICTSQSLATDTDENVSRYKNIKTSIKLQDVYILFDGKTKMFWCDFHKMFPSEVRIAVSDIKHSAFGYF